MGQAVAKLFRAAKREASLYDIERRAHKVLSKDKRISSPKYPSTVKELKSLDEDNVSKDHLYKKNEKLDEYLKKVFVTSNDIAPPIQRTVPPDKPLPQARYNEEFMTYGYSESEEASVPVGRISLKQAMDLIIEHKEDPATNTKPALAAKYKMNETAIDDIVEYFRMFNYHSKKALQPGPQTDHEKLQKSIDELTMRNSSEVVKEIKNWESKYKGSKIQSLMDSAKKPSEKDGSNKENDKDNR